MKLVFATARPLCEVLVLDLTIGRQPCPVPTGYDQWTPE